jgi:isopentenyl diphosphate isomerase/L-lactate dehydrogenase-like FMN-dependent dehydrogenase
MLRTTVRQGRGASCPAVENRSSSRPQVWGLAAFGQPGVEAVIDILDRELAQIMRQAGTPTLASITRKHVVASV